MVIPLLKQVVFFFHFLTDNFIVCYIINLLNLSNYQILNLRWVLESKSSSNTLIRKRIWTGAEKSITENQGKTHSKQQTSSYYFCTRHFVQSSNYTKPISRDILHTSHKRISSKENSLSLWNPNHWWNQYESKSKRMTL